MAAYRDLDTAVTEWLNTCALSRRLESIAGLSDGLLLGELLQQISATHFGHMDLLTEFPAGWTDRLKNLQKIEAVLRSYASSFKSSSLFPSVDLVPIALTQDLQQLHNLLFLVVFCVLNSPAKDLMITRILNLSQASQLTLMNFIKLVTKDEDAFDFVMTPTREIYQLRRAQATLSSQLANVQTEYETVSKEKERIEQEFSELQMTNTDLENKVSRIRKRQYTPDSITLDLEAKLTEKDLQLRLLNDQLLSQRKTHEITLNAYKDEIDSANAKLAQFAKSDENLHSLKQTIEELKPLKEKIRGYIEENENLKKLIEEYQNSESGLATANKLILQLKEIIAQEKTARLKLEAEAMQLETQGKSLMKDNLELVEKTHFLESKNRELALKLEQQSDSLVDDSFAPGTPLQETYPETYEDDSKVARALDFWSSDKSLKNFRENATFAGEIRELKAEKEKLQEIVRNLKAEKEREHAISSAEIVSLKETIEKEVKTLQNALNTAETTYRATIRDLTDQITDLSAAVKAGNMLNSTLNDEIAALKAEKDGFYSEISQLYRNKDELSGKFVASRDETLRLNTELIEKMAKMSNLEQEIANLKVKNEEKTLDSTASLNLQLLSCNSKLSELRLKVTQLESDCKAKNLLLEETEKQLKLSQERFRRLETSSHHHKSRLLRLSRTKEELEAIVSKERGVFRSVTEEMTRTMSELHSISRP